MRGECTMKVELAPEAIVFDINMLTTAADRSAVFCYLTQSGTELKTSGTQCGSNSVQ